MRVKFILSVWFTQVGVRPVDIGNFSGHLHGPCNIFIRSTICLIPTKPQFLTQRNVALVSWKHEKLRFHRYKHLFLGSLRCSAKALVQYGFQNTLLKLLSWWDMAEDRLSNLTSGDTNSIMKSATENTSGSSVKTDMSAAYTYHAPHQSFPYQNSNMYDTNNIPLFHSVARPHRGETWMLEGVRNEQPGSWVT